MNDEVDPKLKGLELFNVLESMQSVVRNLAVGTNEFMARQLIVKSKQQHILKFTPKDSARRFTDLVAYTKWYKNGHTMHWLLGNNYDLAGVIWYRYCEFPQPDILSTIDYAPTETFAIRLYEGYVGHHLSQPFIKLSLKIYIDWKLKNGQQINAMWLSTTLDNAAAISAYSRLGYQEIYRDAKNILMVISAEDLLQIIKATE